MSRELDIAIVGGGPAGLTAAIFASRAAKTLCQAEDSSLRIAVFDSTARPAAKLLLSGGGRCNLTNQQVSPRDYNTSKPHLLNRVLKSFDVPATLAFFNELGVATRCEPDGRIFPQTNHAQTVREALLRAVHDSGIPLHKRHRVEFVRRCDRGFLLAGPWGQLQTRSLILATGGLSVPKTGSDGWGLEIARSLGHSIRPPHPALVPLVLPTGHWLTKLAGLSITAVLELSLSSGRVLARTRGPVLLTHFGLSGPAILDISRHWTACHYNGQHARLTANLLHGATFQQAETQLLAAFAEHPATSLAHVLAQWLPQRLATAICQHAAIDPSQPAAQINREARRRLVHSLIHLELPVIGDRGWNEAEATAGGVPLEELDTTSLASRCVPGLYLCGEMLDVDGRLGGFNLQWAWSSGYVAGWSAARSLIHGSSMPRSRHT